MSLTTRLMPYDVFERHRVTSQLLQEVIGTQKTNVRVLDVGGRVELLAQFLPYQVISINTDPTGHLMGSGLSLPFAAHTFDAVVNIDTLEHLSAANRLPFLQECVRVARRYVVIAAPFGSEGHIAYEKQLDQLYQSIHGRPHPYLHEHVQHGLPRMLEIENFVRVLEPAIDTFQCYFAGDYVWQGQSFRRSVLAQRRPRWLARFINLYNTIASMALFRPIRLRTEPAPTTNRFYLLFTKNVLA